MMLFRLAPILVLLYISACDSIATEASIKQAELVTSVELRPNIILIVSDDHGIDALGAYGNDIIQTPHLDTLAAEGLRFDNAFATTASCSPSRSVLLTGLHNHANGMYGLEHRFHHFSSFDDIKSLPVLLSSEGYRTGRIGKYHLSPESVYQFDVVLDQEASIDAPIGRSTVEMANYAGAFINEGKQPFFLYFATDDPHRSSPFDVAPAPNNFGNRKDSYPGVTTNTYNPEDVEVPGYLPDIPEVRLELAQYYQSVSRLDQGVGRLMALLEESGKANNTVVIYLSDNGAAFPGAKTTLYEPGISLPLIVRAPGQKQQGASTTELVSWTDITPTILEFAGIGPKVGDFHGTSFREIVIDSNKDGASSAGRREVVFGSHTFHEVNMYYPMRMIRTSRYKLIWNESHEISFPLARDLYESTSWQAILAVNPSVFGERSMQDFFQRPELELYDLSADPGETKNIAYDSNQADLVEELLARLRRFQWETGDPWSVKGQLKSPDRAMTGTKQ